LGNFTTLEAMLDHWDPRALRLLVLQTHYRHTMEIGADTLDGAVSALDRLDAFADRFRSANLENSEPDGSVVAKFNEAMDDDLGTPAAVAVIFDAVREANRHLDEDNSDEVASIGCAIETLVDVLGLKIGRDQRPSASVNSDFDDDKIEELIVERNQARESGDYARADEIRDSLFESGIVLEDSAQGTGWHRS